MESNSAIDKEVSRGQGGVLDCMESVSAAEYGARPPSADVRDGTKTMPPPCHPGPAHEGNDRIISGHSRLGDARHIRSTAGTVPNPATTTAVAPLPTLRHH